jgi:hypothetical protein
MRMKLSVVAAVSLLSVSMPPGQRAMAQGCGAAVAAAKQQWWALTQGNHRIPPTMRVNTSDGRQLSGAQLNYAWVLVDRADGACGAAQGAAASGYLRDFDLLLHPAPPRL